MEVLYKDTGAMMIGPENFALGGPHLFVIPAYRPFSIGISLNNMKMVAEL